MSFQRLPQPQAGAEHRRLLQPGGGEDEQVQKGRIAPEAAQLDLLIIKLVIILTGGALMISFSGV